MLSRIDIKVKLNAMPKAKYFQKAGPTEKYDSSFNLLGWTPGSLDSWNVLENIIGCRDANGKGGTFNLRRLLQSQDHRAQQADPGRDRHQEARRADRRGLHASTTRRSGCIPLHQQSLIWGVSKKVQMVQRADNQILFYWVKMQ